MKRLFTNPRLVKKPVVALLTGFFLFIFSLTTTAQLGVYSFTGAGACPNPNAAINSQPANAVFSNYSSVNTSCQGTGNVFETQAWNTTTILNLTQYNSFTITPNAGFTLTLSSITFTENLDQNPGSGTTNWYLRSSLDGYAANIATGTATLATQTPTITLPGANFTNIGAVTFRLYLTNANSNGTKWTHDDVTIAGTVTPAPVQLGIYPFTGVGTCPNQNPAVTAQPANATFSNFILAAGGVCKIKTDQFSSENWTTTNTINLAQYNSFTITPSAGYLLNLTSISFDHRLNVYVGTKATNWVLRSSVDNYASNLATGTETSITFVNQLVNLPVAFSGIGAVTFRFYLKNAETNSSDWIFDNIVVNGTVTSGAGYLIPPTSNSPQCTASGVTMNFSGTPPAGKTWYWQTSAGGTSTANSASPYTVFTSGTYYVREQDNTTFLWSAGAGSVTVTVSPPLGTLIFDLGDSSTRCQGAATPTYTATAANSTGITYDVDIISWFFGVRIDNNTGVATFPAGWNGTTYFFATATGCGGPVTVTHVVTTIGNVTTPAFTLGSTSTRCQGAGTVLYEATSANSSGITYSLNVAAGNSIDASTGNVTWAAGFSGTAIITATATGCNGPRSSNHTVTINQSVTIPVFTLGAISTRCQAAGTVTYLTTVSYNTSKVYSLDSLTDAFPGNGIAPASGLVTYAAGWSGLSVITVTTTGCNGPTTATHTVTTTPTVGTPVFNLGTTITRCQGAGTLLCDAHVTNATTLKYYLDLPSKTGGNIIDSLSGMVGFAAGWTGNSTVTATATGCNGPKSAIFTIIITPTVGVPVFGIGATSWRCFGAGVVTTYGASATTSDSIRYSLDAVSIAAGNSINPVNGDVTYIAAWTGTTSVITATAYGCNGPKTAIHTVTIRPQVRVPVFLPPSLPSPRCQGIGTVTFQVQPDTTNFAPITYSLEAGSPNGIGTSTGIVLFSAGWSGTSYITATTSATGCGGPKSATYTYLTTPTVGFPVFVPALPATRCQGVDSVIYAATATNNTGITYYLDATSRGAGNTIDSTSGKVKYVANWSGLSTITATAAGCNGPRSSTFAVNTTATVSTPVFNLGLESVRDQAAQVLTYSAYTVTPNTGIIYTLDSASLAGGNTIIAATGQVTWAAGWYGVSAVKATASGCNGPSFSSHIIIINPTVVQAPLYLSIPGQALDRIDPVATNITTTEVSAPIGSGTGGVTLDAISTTTGITASISVAHTTGTGSNRLMLVGISQANRTVTSVTYGSTALTLVGQDNNNANARISIYQLVNPPAGAATVTVNFSSAITRGAVINVTTYSGVNQTTPLGSFSASDGKSGNPTVSVSSATGELVYDVVSLDQETATVGSGQTQRWNTSSASNITGAGSTKPGASSTTMSWTASSSTDWAIGAVSIKPANITNNITFTQNPPLCSNLIIKAQLVQVQVYANVLSGTMPATPSVTATIKYGSTNIITLSNPVYNSSSKLMSWSASLPADVTVPAGQALELLITSSQTGVQFQIEYHSNTRPSRISLLPVSTFIDFQSFDVYNAPYPGGSIRISGNVNTTYYVRGKLTTPFGYRDITGMDVTITPTGSTVSATCVDSSSCSRTYEYAWTTPATTNLYYLLGTGKQGYENVVKNTDLQPFDVCSFCPPVALTDSATGAGGAPIVVDVLANDYDPNNNIKVSTLAIAAQGNNGTGYISNNRLVYLPNGSYAGRDTITYQICDSTALCGTGKVYFIINPLLVDPCSEANSDHVYYLPFSENEARIALDSSTNQAFPSNNIRTIISLKMPYPGMTVVWDQWEDGYELNALNPLQSTTLVWGDGNPYNGIAPGYSSDIIPAGGSIVLDNTIPTNPRVSSNLFYDGKDKITASGQITVTQVCGEPTNMAVQCMKTNVSSTIDYGQSFTIPVGQNFNSPDFAYSALFIRAAQNNTTVLIDKDNNGTLETSATINEGEVLHVNGGVFSGATITANGLIGVEYHSGGNDNFSSRDEPIFPATWYSNTYYTPVPTVRSPDTAAVFLYNNLNRPITINWLTSATPSSGSITLSPKTTTRFPLALSATAAYKFVNPTGESFTAIQMCDSYTPGYVIANGGPGNSGLEFDWSFNLIAENRLTDFATVAWAPGSINGSRNDNPIWVTGSNTTANTTVYVKYNGNVNSGGVATPSPCGLHYDALFTLAPLKHLRLKDGADMDQSGLALFTCDGTKIAAVYGEDASTAQTGSPSWDVGSTIQPFCKEKLIFANDDYGRTMINQPVTIPVLLNDFGFLAVVDPATVTNAGLLQASHGTITINANGTISYLPDVGYTGKDTFEYTVCSTPSPIVCDNALVFIDVSSCPAPFNENVLAGSVFVDKNSDGINNDGGTGKAGPKVYLYIDGNCNTVAEPNELSDSITVDNTGAYQFITYPERAVEDDFDGPGGTTTCDIGSDGNAVWPVTQKWIDAGDASSVGFCKGSATANCDVFKDGAFSYGIRLKNANVSATRQVDLTGAAYAFLTFSYHRKSAIAPLKDLIVQASSNGTTFGTVFTIAGDGNSDAAPVTIYNQDITTFAGPTTYIRFLTNSAYTNADSVYIDNVKIQYIKYPICYITKLNTATVPPFYHTTTVTQHSVTATSSQTCLAPFDFGIAKDMITLSGTLFKDPNGIMDTAVNGTPIGTINTAPVYAYLIDSTGKIVRKTILNTATGAYTFPNTDMYTNYVLRLSLTSVNIGDVPPSDAALSSAAGNWVSTGDAFGTNNAAGNGIKPGTATTSINLSTTNANITAVNFGIERLPDSDDKTLLYPRNDPGIQYNITGGLTGSDPEDGVLAAGKTYKITQLPVGAVLLYNNLGVILNQVITSFNPALLQIDPDDDTHQAIFRYASRDAAGLYDPTPATVVVNWAQTLPVKLISFSGRLNVDKVDLNWVTASELNTKHYEVERGSDGRNFTKLATVLAKGNSSTATSYDLVDPIPLKGVSYYRLKIVDIDGSYEYSQIVIIRIDGGMQLVTKVAPNPFTGKIDVYLTLTHNTPVDFRFIDFNGRMVFNKSVKGLKGFNWFTINDLEKLPSAPYMLHIKTDDATIVEKLIKQ